MADSSYLIEIILEAQDRASSKIRALQRQVDDLKASAAGKNATGDLGKGLEDAADSAERAAAGHEELNKQHQEMRRAAPQTDSSIRQTAKLQEEAAQSATGHAESLQELRRQQQLLPQDAATTEASVKRIASTHDQAAESVATHALATSSVGDEAQQATPKIKELAAAAQNMEGHFQGAASATRDLSDEQKKAATRGDELLGKMQRLDETARSHAGSTSQLKIAYSDLSKGLRSVWGEFEIGSSEAKKFGSAMEQAASKAKNVNLAQAAPGLMSAWANLASGVDKVGVKIVSLSAELRGFALAGVAELAQQLDTGLLSLGGSFVSVASGAAQAGAAIGGVFLSGLGQLIPMVSVGIAGLLRLRAVFAAVQAQQQVQQQASASPFQGQITQLQNINQLITAQQSLTNSYVSLHDAQEHVRESQIALTTARIDAIRNITNLTLAEKDAQLQLEGANLSLVQAQQQQQVAQATGDQSKIQTAQLAVQEAQLGQQRAQVQVPRSQQDLARAQSYGIAGSPGVLSAAEAYKQSQLAVVQAQQQIAQAQRQVQITQLTLRQPSSSASSQQTQLKYLEAQMSGPEKALFNVLSRMETELRSPNSPLKKITDYFIQPFLDAANRLQQLLGDPKFLKPIDALAKAMGGAMSAIEKVMFGRQGTSFFETMAKDATKSIPVVTRAITGLMKVFEDIAKAAAPAFRSLSGDWANFWNSLNAKDSSASGQKRLTDFFNQAAKYAEDFAHLGSALFDLFKAIGRDAAPSGMRTVTTFTDSIKDATTWVQNHGPEVKRFFDEARQGLSLIAGVLFQVGKDMISVFSLTSLQALGQFLTQILLPGLRLVVSVIGFVVTKFIQFFDLFGGPGRVALEVIGGIVASVIAFGKLYGPILKMVEAWKMLRAATMAAYEATKVFMVLNQTGNVWDAAKGAVSALTTKYKELTVATDAAKDSTIALRNTSVAADAEEVTAEQGVGASYLEATAAIRAQSTIPPGLPAPGPRTAGSSAAQGAEIGAAGAAGLSVRAALLTRVLPVGVLAALADKTNVFGQNIQQGQQTKGLGSVLGPIGGTHERGISLSGFENFVSLGLLGSSTASNQSSGTTNSLTALQNGLKGITDPSQLSTTQLQKLYEQAMKIQQLPDITAKQRAGLQQLTTILNPANAALQKNALQWESTFAGINVTTGNVMQQTQQQLAQNIQAISTNLGTGTKQGAQALVGTIYAAWQNVLQNTSAAVRGTQKGVQEISNMLNTALKAMGETPLSNTQVAHLSSADITGLLSGQFNTSELSPMPHAKGGWHEAASSGKIVQVGEGGHDEVTLTTDPKYAPRQRALLGRYLRRAPHLASMDTGGYVYPFPPGTTIGRTDQGVDANMPVGAPIGPMGPSKVMGILQNWFQGQPLVWWQLLAGPRKGQDAYVAEQINSIAPVGSVLSANQAVARYAPSGTGIEYGWATSGGSTLARATSGYTEGQVTPAGSAMRSFIAGLSHGVISGGGMAAAAIQKLVAPKVKGVAGAIGTLAQAVVNMSTSAANKYLQAHAPAGSTGTGAGVSGGTFTGTLSGSVEKQVYQFMSASGFNKIAIAGMLGNAVQESSMNPNAAGGGLWQQISNFGNAAPPLLVQMRTMLPQIQGIKAAMNAASSPGEAATTFMTGFEKPGIPELAHRIAGADAAFASGYAVGGMLHLRKKVLGFAEGGRAPWGGEPVPIVAHEGERVVNPPQWNEIGRLTGMGASGLDSHLGYDRGSPRQHFAPGGQVGYGTSSGSDSTVWKRPSTPVLGTVISAADTFLSNITSNLFTMDPGSATRALSVVGQVFSRVTKGFAAIGKLGGPETSSKLKQLDNLIGALDNTTNGVLTQLAAAFQRFQTNLANSITSIGYGLQNVTAASAGRQRTRRVGRRNVPTGAFAGTGFGGVRIAGPALTASDIGQTGQTAIDELTVASLVAQNRYIGDEQKAVGSAISRIKRSISRVQHARGISKSVRQKALKDLESQYTDLIQQQETLTTAMNQGITSTFQAEQTYIQDTLSQISDVFQTQQQQLQTQQSSAQTLGQYGQLPSIDQALATSAQAQIAALQPVLSEAIKTGNPDLVAQITQQISQLQSTIVQATAQMIQDSISAIQQAAATTQAQISEYQSIGQTLAGAGNFAASGAYNASALNLNQSSLQGQLSSYNSLLGQAISQGNQGAIATITQTIDQLTAELASNTQAIQDNTATVVAETAQYIQSRGQFQTGTFSGLSQIINTIGQTTGFTDVASLKQLTSASNASLQGTQTGLLGQLGQLGGGATGIASLLGSASTPQQFVAALSGVNMTQAEAGQSATWVTTFENLISNLTSNTEAIAQNNQQLATLNGQLLQPQSWSTTAWTSFRDAIFSGMGNLLPQYQSSLPVGSQPMIAPMFGSVSSNNTAGPTIGTLNLTHPVEKLDPQLLGQQLQYELATAP